MMYFLKLTGTIFGVVGAVNAVMLVTSLVLPLESSRGERNANAASPRHVQNL